MRRYIVLLLITGILWAQTDFDKLVLKDGTTYFEETEVPAEWDNYIRINYEFFRQQAP